MEKENKKNQELIKGVEETSRLDSQNQKKFVKRSEMTIEDLKNLKLYNVVFTENQKTKTGTFAIELLKDVFVINAPGAKNRIYFDLTKWNLIKRRYSVTGSFAKRLPMRFIKGVGKSGRVYYSWELHITKTIKESGFFTSLDLEFIEDLVASQELEIDWVESDQVIDDESTNYDVFE